MVAGAASPQHSLFYYKRYINRYLSQHIFQHQDEVSGEPVQMFRLAREKKEKIESSIRFWMFFHGTEIT